MRLLFVVLTTLLTTTLLSSQNRWQSFSEMTDKQWGITLLATTDNNVLPDSIGGRSVLDVQVETAKEASKFGNVRVGFRAEQYASVRDALRKAIPSDRHNNITMCPMDFCDVWTRDTGPMWKWKRGKADEESECSIVAPMFTLWGYVGAVTHNPAYGLWGYCDVPSTIPFYLWAYTDFEMDAVREWNTEGGDKSVYDGVLLMDAHTETQRNPEKSLTEIEVLAKHALAVNSIIWVGLDAVTGETFQPYDVDDNFSWKPVQLDDGRDAYTPIGTGGHVDEFARLVGRNAKNGKLLLLLADDDTGESCPPLLTAARNKSRARLARARENLLALYGDDIEIVDFPTKLLSPITITKEDPIYENLENLRGVELSDTVPLIAASSYMNFVKINDGILLPKYGHPSDARARHILQDLFPKATIVGIDPTAVNFGGGGMHCITNNQPDCASNHAADAYSQGICHSLEVDLTR